MPEELRGLLQARSLVKAHQDRVNKELRRLAEEEIRKEAENFLTKDEEVPAFGVSIKKGGLDFSAPTETKTRYIDTDEDEEARDFADLKEEEEEDSDDCFERDEQD